MMEKIWGYSSNFIIDIAAMISDDTMILQNNMISKMTGLNSSSNPTSLSVNLRFPYSNKR
jgi:hypothetical protein